jgi:hypothetical protein
VCAAGFEPNATRIWESRPEPVPEGRPTIAQRFNAGWGRSVALIPALKRWASLDHPFGINDFGILWQWDLNLRPLPGEGGDTCDMIRPSLNLWPPGHILPDAIVNILLII